jgi:hypothetical protein
MKVAIALLTLFALVLVEGARLRLVGFHYPVVVQNQPLLHPIKVSLFQGTNLLLQDGDVIALDVAEASDISNTLSQSAFEVDIEGDRSGRAAIYGRRNGWICGTPWAQPIRIPLIRDIVYKNRRELIAVGDYVSSNDQPQPAANGSQPFSLVPTPTPSTASAADAGR